MDIFLPIVILVILFILFSMCGWCCKRQKQGIVYGNPPTVTTQTSTAYGVTTNPPYPVDQPMVQPQPGFNTGAPIPPYPTNPGHPMPGFPPAPVAYGYQPVSMPMPRAMPMPMPRAMPMPMGGPGFGAGAIFPPPTTPYPPAGLPYPPPQPVTVMNPPSYAEAVGQPTVTELYPKQAPYNPNFDA